MAIFNIPVSWEAYGSVEVEAESIEEAVNTFDANEDGYPLPEGNYIDGSFKREDLDFVKEFNSHP